MGKELSFGDVVTDTPIDIHDFTITAGRALVDGRAAIFGEIIGYTGTANLEFRVRWGGGGTWVSRQAPPDAKAYRIPDSAPNEKALLEVWSPPKDETSLNPLMSIALEPLRG